MISLRSRVLALQVLLELLSLQNKELQSGEDCYFTLINKIGLIASDGLLATPTVSRVQ